MERNSMPDWEKKPANKYQQTMMQNELKRECQQQIRSNIPSEKYRERFDEIFGKCSKCGSENTELDWKNEFKKCNDCNFERVSFKEEKYVLDKIKSYFKIGLEIFVRNPETKIYDNSMLMVNLVDKQFILQDYKNNKNYYCSSSLEELYEKIKTEINLKKELEYLN